MSLVSRISVAKLSTAAVLSVVSGTAALAADELEAVVVTATRVEQPVSEVIGSVTVITRADIEKRQVQSVQELLKGEAGIDIANSGGFGKLSSVFVRGANASQTLILVDGQRLGSATAGLTSLEYLPVDQIERIEIVRGPRSSLYGSDAIGGVIQIFTRRNDGVNASASVGSHNTEDYSAGFGMQGDGLRFSVNGAYQHSDGFDACTGSYSGGCFTIEPDKDSYRNGSASARVGYALGERADLELSTLYSKGFTEFDGGFTNQTRFSNSTPNLRLQVTATPVLTLSFNGGVALDKNDNFSDGVFTGRFNTEKRNASAQGDWRIGSHHTVSVGVDYLKDIVDSDTMYDQTERDNEGVFAQYLGKLGAHQLSASIRRDDNQQFGTHTTGNAGWQWQIMDDALSLNAGAGTAFHAPTFNDLYYPASIWGDYSNADLKPEHSRSYEFGAKGVAGWLAWSAQLYHTDVKDLIATDSNFYPGNISQARLRGAELTLQGQWQQLSTRLNYTLQDPRSREAGSNHDHVLARRARQSGRLELDYDFGTANAGLTLNAVGKRFDNLANTIELPGYATLDIRAQAALGHGFALQAKVGNFLDRDYETVRYYRQAGRTFTLTLRYQLAK